MEKLKEIPVKQLKENDEFKLSKHKRSFHVFKKFINLGDNVQTRFKGKILVIRKDCKQLVVNNTATCFLKIS